MRLLVTAGPTREFFDSVRFISNPSSGRMGYALAREAAARGHEVILISGPVALAPPPGVRTIQVTSAQEMFAACTAAFDESDALIMTAAVSDYRPARRLPRKLKKRNQPQRITLVPTPDILAHLGARKGQRVVIGFAMEDHDAHQHAESKLRRKKCDAIVLNGPGNVGSDNATIEILTAGGKWTAPQSGSKADTAHRILDLVDQLVAARQKGRDI
ncbi:MAG TPA: phosphopantothenoylcysteine decarboxylase [Phycisphaerae bacterium]